MVAGATFVILIDNNVLVQLLTDRAASDKLVRYLQQNKSLVIPTPVVAEFLAYDYPKRVPFFMQMKNTCAQIAPFNEKAAVICGELASKLDAIKANKPKQKVKIDLQIVSIAVSMNIKSILTQDDDIRKIVELLQLRLDVISVADLPKDLPLFDA